MQSLLCLLIRWKFSLKMLLSLSHARRRGLGAGARFRFRNVDTTNDANKRDLIVLLRAHKRKLYRHSGSAIPRTTTSRALAKVRLVVYLEKYAVCNFIFYERRAYASSCLAQTKQQLLAAVFLPRWLLSPVAA